MTVHREWCGQCKGTALCATTTTTTTAALHHNDDGENWKPELACMNCVSCCNPLPISDLVRERTRETWIKEERAHAEALQKSQEQYRARFGTHGDEQTCFGNMFSNNIRSYNMKLSTLLPMIVLKGDGTMVQYDIPEPPPQGDGERRSGSSSRRSPKPKVSLNSLYRESSDSVAYSPTQEDRGKRNGAGKGETRLSKTSSSSDLVHTLGLLRVEVSAMRLRRGLASLQTLLLPLKMTNVSITARVEKMGFEDYVRVCDRHHYYSNGERDRVSHSKEIPLKVFPKKRATGTTSTGSRRPLQSQRGYDLLSDEFSSSGASDSCSSLASWDSEISSSSSPSHQKRREKGGKRKVSHWRCWSWDSGFGGSFKDHSVTSTSLTPPQGEKENVTKNEGKEQASASGSSMSSLTGLRVRESLRSVCSSVVNNGICDTIRRWGIS